MNDSGDRGDSVFIKFIENESELSPLNIEVMGTAKKAVFAVTLSPKGNFQ